jgi:tRNA-2-methylthio-N6-dimethylallyladenosine synthase
MKEDVVRAHAELGSLCEHIHLPLQAGSSRVLKRMRRTYSRERFLDRVALIREHVPDCSITTDIIVGFPGETEDDFAQTLEVAEEVGFDGAFTFIYSPRRGTEAAAFVEEFLPHDVLVEGHDRHDAGRIRGRTTHNKVVNFDGLAAPGEIVGVAITGATSQTLTGEESLLARAGR